MEPIFQFYFKLWIFEFLIFMQFFETQNFFVKSQTWTDHRRRMPFFFCKRTHFPNPFRKKIETREFCNSLRPRLVFLFWRGVLKAGLPAGSHCAAWFIVVCQCAAQLVEMEICTALRYIVQAQTWNLHCIALHCARTNVIRLLLVLQKKIGVCAHLVGTKIDWFLESAIVIRFIYHISEKNILKKKCKVPRKRHWVTPLFKSRDIPLLNNSVTQWRCFFEYWCYLMTTFLRNFGLFFKCSRTKSGTGLRIDEHRFFVVPTNTVLRHPALFCTVCFGAALHGTTLRNWWKHTLIWGLTINYPERIFIL